MTNYERAYLQGFTEALNTGLTKSAQSITGAYYYPSYSQDMMQMTREHPKATLAVGLGAPLVAGALLTSPLWGPAVATGAAAAGPALATGTTGASALAKRYGAQALNAAKTYGSAAYNATINAAKTYGPAALNATKRYGAQAINAAKTYGPKAYNAALAVPKFGWRVLNYGTSNFPIALLTFGGRTIRGLANFSPKQPFAPIYSKINGASVGLIPGITGAGSRIAEAYNFMRHPVESSLSTITASSQIKRLYDHRESIKKWLYDLPTIAWTYLEPIANASASTTLAVNEFEKAKAEARRGENYNETISKAKKYNQDASNALKTYVQQGNNLAHNQVSNMASRVENNAMNNKLVRVGDTLVEYGTTPAKFLNKQIDKATQYTNNEIDRATTKIENTVDKASNFYNAGVGVSRGYSPSTTAVTALGYGKEPITAMDMTHLDQIPYVGALVSKALEHVQSPLKYLICRPAADWQNYNNSVPKEERSMWGRTKYILNGIGNELLGS